MRTVSWNMQGGLNTQYLNQMVQATGPNVLCLQECGRLSDVLQGVQDITDPASGLVIGCTGNMMLGQDFMECVWWDNAAWVQGSLAIMSNAGFTAYGIYPAAVPPFMPANPRSMPWLTLTDPGTGTPITFYSLHGPPVWGTTTIADVCQWDNAQIVLAAGVGGTWACVGDFNADPTVPGYIYPPAGVVVSGGQPTQQSGGILDYAVTNGPLVWVGQDEDVPSASDHYPQLFDW